MVMLRYLTVSITLMTVTAAMPILPFNGIAATKYLLQGTKQLWSKTESHKRYAKLGDFKTALQDFYEVDPRRVQIVSKGTKVLKITGQVGTRQLILRKCSFKESCLPVLEIRRPEGKIDSAYTYNLMGYYYRFCAGTESVYWCKKDLVKKSSAQQVPKRWNFSAGFTGFLLSCAKRGAAIHICKKGDKGHRQSWK